MEISVVPNDSIRIKGKKSSLLIDPSMLTTKTETDAVLFFNQNSNLDLKKVSGQRVLIAGPGDYEVGGIKISGVSQNKNIFYTLNVDGLSVLLATTEMIDRLKDTIDGHTVCLLYANMPVDRSSVGTLSSRVVVMYGEKVLECMQIFSKSQSSQEALSYKKISKLSISPEKLPGEMEIMFLQN